MSQIHVFVEDIECAAAYGRGLEQYVTARGFDFAPAAKLIGISPEILQDFRARVSMDRLTRLFEMLSGLLGDPCLGLNFAASFNMGDTGPIGLGMMNAPSLRHAWEFYCRFKELSLDHSYYHIEFGRTHVHHQWAYSPLLTQTGQFTDFGILLSFRHIRAFAGPAWIPRSLTLQRAPPPNLAPYIQSLGPATSFEAYRNQCIYPASDLEHTKPEADPRIYEVMFERCEVALASLREKSDIFRKTRHMIMSTLQFGGSNLPQVAQAMAIGERSLQRRLARYNLTFEKLVEETRRELSETLLQRPELSISEVARHCGYSSNAAYSRAVRSWYGKSPVEMRRTLTQHRSPHTES